jgi:hypothetical protein
VGILYPIRLNSLTRLIGYRGIPYKVELVQLGIDIGSLLRGIYSM